MANANHKKHQYLLELFSDKNGENREKGNTTLQTYVSNLANPRQPDYSPSLIRSLYQDIIRQLPSSPIKQIEYDLNA